MRSGRYTAGTATHYSPSLLTGKGDHQHLAQGFVVGTRFHSAPVIRLADAKPMHLGHVVKADGRFRIIAFAGAGDPAAANSAIRRLCDFLAQDPASPVRKYTRGGEDIDAVIDVRAVFQQAHRELAIEAMPALLLPRKGRFGLLDYEKMFCADIKGGNDIFAMRGIDREGRMYGRRAAGPICRACAAARWIRAARVIFRRLHAAAIREGCAADGRNCGGLNGELSSGPRSAIVACDRCQPMRHDIQSFVQDVGIAAAGFGRNVQTVIGAVDLVQRRVRALI